MIKIGVVKTCLFTIKLKIYNYKSITTYNWLNAITK